MCCSGLQCAAVCCSHKPCAQGSTEKCAAVCVAVCSGVLQCAALMKHVLKAAVNTHFLSALQCVAVCHSLLQYVAVKKHVWEASMNSHLGCCSLVWKGALYCYRVATFSRLLKIIGLFCKRAL